MFCYTECTSADDSEGLERRAKPKELKCLVFGLCFLQAVLETRGRFGPPGFSVCYAFGAGDLRAAANVWVPAPALNRGNPVNE